MGADHVPVADPQQTPSCRIRCLSSSRAEPLKHRSVSGAGVKRRAAELVSAHTIQALRRRLLCPGGRSSAEGNALPISTRVLKLQVLSSAGLG